MSAANPSAAPAAATVIEAKPEVASDPWGDLAQLPARLTVELWVPKFTIGQLMKLDLHSIVDTRWQTGIDVPLRANGQLIGWVEFEVSGEQLSVRLTRLA